jgi:hypothetical protein
VSYVDQDQQTAEQLAETLRAAGFTVMHPSLEVYPGDNWEKLVGNALEQAEIMIVLITRNVYTSYTLQRQVQYALTSASGKFEGRVIPVIVDMPTYSAGENVPWVLVWLNPVHVNSGADECWTEVVERARSVAAEVTHAAS